MVLWFSYLVWAVSTHSRPKAAGRIVRATSSIAYRFNTQPPEGGWWIQSKVLLLS